VRRAGGSVCGGQSSAAVSGAVEESLVWSVVCRDGAGVWKIGCGVAFRFDARSFIEAESIIFP
jgi:hypothetical protein